jgi:hypothetical protein
MVSDSDNGVPGFQFNPDTGLPSLRVTASVLACTSRLAAASAV